MKKWTNDPCHKQSDSSLILSFVRFHSVTVHSYFAWKSTVGLKKAVEGLVIVIYVFTACKKQFPGSNRVLYEEIKAKTLF